MSSAILYLAIVAIWAGILVPRWLRNDGSQVGSHPAGLSAGADAASADGPPEPAADPVPGSQSPAADAAAGQPVDPGAERRARVLGARRRLLAMLLVLVAGAAFIAVTRLGAWWVVVPPAVMLAGYLGLLREAARADAERAQAALAASTRARRALAEAEMAAYEQAAARRPEARGKPAAAASRAAPPQHAAPSPHGQPEQPGTPEQPAASAEVLDISARVAEEPYDQYADARLRAVGD